MPVIKCKTEQVKQWRKNNPERVSEANKRYREKNREKVLERQRNWRQKNKEKSREYYINNREKMLQQSKQAYLFRIAERFGVTVEYIKQLYADGCEICGENNRRKLAIDHDHKTGRIRGCLCHNCNMIIGKLIDTCNGSLLDNLIKYHNKSIVENKKCVLL